MTYTRLGSYGKSTTQSLEVLSPSNIKPEDIINLEGYLDGRDAGDDNVHQTRLTISPNIYKFWGYSIAAPNKIIWRCNGRSNVLNMVSKPTGDGTDVAVYNNSLFTYPNIGYASDNGTEYIIDIYPTDYEDSGTYTMVYGSYQEGFVDNGFPGDEDQDDYHFHGYLYPTTFMGKKIGMLQNIGGENKAWMRIDGSQSSLPDNIRLTVNNVNSNIFYKDSTFSDENYTGYSCDEYAIVSEEGYIGQNKYGYLITLEPL